MFLLKVTAALEAARVPYALVGGFAVALHGAVRGTLDIDLILRFSEKHFLAAEKALATIGLQPRLPVSASEVYRFREEYIRNRNLHAWSFVNPGRPSEIVDIVLTENLANVKVRRVKVRDRSVRIVAAADLVRMKEASGRPQDLEDARALKELL